MKFIYSSLFILFLCSGCRKSDACITDYFVPLPPYSDPIWHPDGKLLGFNHLPLAGLTIVDQSPCGADYNYSYKFDSAGFWIINADGTNQKRLTRFTLLDPCWSPDGKWIAYSDGLNLCKMAFDGSSLDTNHIIQLTSGGSKNIFPAWSKGSLFFNSNRDEPDGTITYYVYKLDLNTLSVSQVNRTGIDSISINEPFIYQDDKILHCRPIDSGVQLVSMDTLGYNVKQITTSNPISSFKRNPRYFNNKVYYQDAGIWSTNMDGSGVTQIVANTYYGFSISPDGTIAYVNLIPYDGHPNFYPDKTHGVIWTMNLDGSNKHQLTFNSY